MRTFHLLVAPLGFSPPPNSSWGIYTLPNSDDDIRDLQHEDNEQSYSDQCQEYPKQMVTVSVTLPVTCSAVRMELFHQIHVVYGGARRIDTKFVDLSLGNARTILKYFSSGYLLTASSAGGEVSESIRPTDRLKGGGCTVTVRGTGRV